MSRASRRGSQYVTLLGNLAIHLEPTMRAGIWDGISRCGRAAEECGTSIMSRRFRLCTLKRRIRLSPELSRSAPSTALHLRDRSRIPPLTIATGVLLPRWEPRNTQGLPIHNSVNFTLYTLHFTFHLRRQINCCPLYTLRFTLYTLHP